MISINYFKQYINKPANAIIIAFFSIFVASCTASSSGGGGFGKISDFFGDGGKPISGFDGNAFSELDEEDSANQVTKIGLILPLSSKGKLGEVAQSLRNAAEFALIKHNNANLSLIIKDSGGKTEQARKQTMEAINEGAELIIGPLLKDAVQGSGWAARPHHVPVVAFSTSTQVAGSGVYLLSYLPSQEVKAIAEYATKMGKKRFAALIPNTEYGNIVASHLTTNVKSNGAQLVKLERYISKNVSNMQPQIKRIAELSKSGKIDSLFIAEGFPLVNSISQMLEANGFDNSKVQILGTGSFADKNVNFVRLLDGAWYPGISPMIKKDFNNKYQSIYGVKPHYLAGLAFDAVSLVAALSSLEGGIKYNLNQLNSPRGFNGSNGIFRFNRDGLVEWGYAILRVSNQGAKLVSNPPNSFNY